VHRLRERGVRVPDDVAVVGYDDIRFAEFLEVPLTTVSLPKYEIGRRAAEILFQRIAQPEEDRRELSQVLLQPSLVVRSSCGASTTP
jgi:DNA-binding LacI/PurR family transcriptional regulator